MILNGTLNPYEAGLMIDYTVKGIEERRPLFFTSCMTESSVMSYRDYLTFDIGMDGRQNVMGQTVNPDIDVNAVRLPGFATGQISCAYTKEAVGSPDYLELSQREFGEQVDTVATKNFAAAYARNVAEQMGLAYKRMENLHEWTMGKILLDGKVTLKSDKADTVVWDFYRNVLTNTSSSTTNAAAHKTANEALMNEVVSEIDLTAYFANVASGSFSRSGGLSWDSVIAGGTSKFTPAELQTQVSPVRHLQRMLELSMYCGAGCDKILMTDSAYSWFLKDLKDNYADTWDTTKNTNIRTVEEIVPMLRTIEGLEFKRFWDSGNGLPVPIYIYRATFIDRDTGVRKRYVEDDGTVLLIPPRQYAEIKYGRIENMKSNYEPMKTFVNFWSNQKTGVTEWELERKFFQYHKNINSAIKWKVCTTSAV